MLYPEPLRQTLGGLELTPQLIFGPNFSNLQLEPEKKLTA